MQATAEQTRTDVLGIWDKLAIGLVLAATGRAITLAFIGRVGDGGAGDPPDAWLMPLVGDASIGLTAPLVALLLWKRPAPTTWLLAVVWSALAIFDAIAAFLVEISAPWPEFFMIQAFGRSMFALAVCMHLTAAALLFRTDTRARFGIPH